MKKITTTIWFGNTFVNLARMRDAAGNLITQGGLSSIALNIYDLDGATPATPIHTSAPSIASVVFDTLQTDGRWGVDPAGYNFRDLVAHTVLPTAEHHYRCVYEFTATDGTKYPAVFEVLATSPVP